MKENCHLLQVVSVCGLVVNLAGIFAFRHAHGHSHGQSHGHDAGHHGHSHGSHSNHSGHDHGHSHKGHGHSGCSDGQSHKTSANMQGNAKSVEYMKSYIYINYMCFLTLVSGG